MSSYRKAALQDKTKKELLEIANVSLGLGIKGTMRKDQIINFILHNQSRSQISNVAEVVSDEEVKATKHDDLPPGYAIIRVDKGKHNPKGRPVYVGGSNKKKQENCLIPVGRPVKIPEKFLEPLLTAVRMELEQDPATLEETEREVHTYPFTILRHNPSPWWINAHGSDYENLGAL